MLVNCRVVMHMNNAHYSKAVEFDLRTGLYAALPTMILQHSDLLYMDNAVIQVSPMLITIAAL